MKRKNYICIGLCTLFIALLLWNCTDMDLAGDSSRVQHENFSLLEAKEFFEKQTLKFSASTRSTEKSYNSRLSPRDFVPDWTKTVVSSQKHIVSYDIPIESEYQCKAIYTDYKNGKATASFVNVYQKLVIVKDVKTNRLGQYILTLIPDGKYEKRYKNRICDKFINAGDKSDFTGIAIYTIPNLNSIIRVNHYTNGIKDRGVFLSGNREQVMKKISIALSILKGITLKRKAVSATRSYGEDDWMDDWWNSGGSIEKDGDDWIFKDENGNSFIMEDFDGDGVPDTVVVTPDDWDPFPDPDSFPYPDDNTDDDVRCSFCGSLWCGGECQVIEENNPESDNVMSEQCTKIKDALDKATVKDIGGRKFTIKEGIIDGLASGVANGKIEDVLYKNVLTEITINKGLTNIQLKLVISHEYVHIILYEKSRVAGSAVELSKRDKDLYDYITAKNDAQEAHHEYMGKHPEIMESVLKKAFPSESDFFYEYGKWAGGGVHSETFDQLGKEEQRKILSFLSKNKL